ncbi:MAG: hypothetical protein ACRYGG_23265 [Janthinobacterium lividum]
MADDMKVICACGNVVTQDANGTYHHIPNDEKRCSWDVDGVEITTRLPAKPNSNWVGESYPDNGYGKNEDSRPWYKKLLGIK